MPKAHWLNKISLISTNQILIEASVFVRNIIIARLLGAETLGEFIFLILSIRLFAMSTDLAVDRYILQTDKKDLKSALSTAHFITRIRNGLLAFMLVIFGLYNVHGISITCYLLLAGGAGAQGFVHQGYRLKQRSLNFRPALYVDGVSNLFGTVAIYVAASTGTGLETLCTALLAQGLLRTALSHVMSDQHYHSKVTQADFMKAVLYGWPLMITGMAMFWSMQGERVILSAILPADAFAHFTMLIQLALVPVLIISRISLTIGLPALANTKHTNEHFGYRLKILHIAHYIIGSLFALGFVLFANPLLGLLFGAEFRAEGLLVTLIALMQLLRLWRMPISIAAQSLGQTDIPFKSNLVRVAAVVAMFFTAVQGASITTLIVIGIVGELFTWFVQSLLYSLRNRTASKTSEETQPNVANIHAKGAV